MIVELPKKFGPGVTKNDLLRLSVRLCEEKELIKNNRSFVFLDIYESVFMGLLFTSIIQFLRTSYVISFLISLLLILIYRRLKYRTFLLNMKFLDTTYLYVNKKFNDNG